MRGSIVVGVEKRRRRVQVQAVKGYIASRPRARAKPGIDAGVIVVIYLRLTDAGGNRASTRKRQAIIVTISAKETSDDRPRTRRVDLQDGPAPLIAVSKPGVVLALPAIRPTVLALAPTEADVFHSIVGPRQRHEAAIHLFQGDIFDGPPLLSI